MCGRFGLYSSAKDLEDRYDADNEADYDESYNIPPGSQEPVVTRNSPQKIRLMKWGLVPFWAKEPRVKYSTINARSESVVSSPAYRVPVRKHRCLVPMNHFFEWDRKGKQKFPYLFKVKSQKIFSVAGIYDIWKDAEKKEFFSFSLMTTRANKVVGKIHDRMPVILRNRDEERWLNSEAVLSDVTALLKPYKDDDMESWQVSKAVNKPGYDNKDTMKRVEQTTLIK